MKRIFRSPIEPEFTELVARTLRGKRDRLFSFVEKIRGSIVKAAFSFTDRVRVSFREYVDRMPSFLRRERVSMGEEKKGAPAASEVSATPAVSRSSHFATYKERYVLIGLLVIGIALGAVAKSEARESIMIGFEDYKVGRESRAVDLNDLEEQMLVGKSPAPTLPEGEQCAE